MTDDVPQEHALIAMLHSTMPFSEALVVESDVTDVNGNLVNRSLQALAAFSSSES